MAAEIKKTTLVAPELQSAGPNSKLLGLYPSKGKQFLSAVQTGTGSAQSVAHGLGAVPAGVLIVPQDNVATAITEGTHTTTNVVVTITSTAKYKILAWL